MQNLFPSNLPTIDPNRFWDNYVTRYGDDGEGHTGSVGIPEIVRSEYWKEGIDSAFAIRELQKKLASRNTGTDRSARELKWKLESLPAYLIETELFFGDESAEVLRQILKERAGFEFDENFNIRPATIELKTTTGEIGMATATKRAKATKPARGKAAVAKKTATKRAKIAKSRAARGKPVVAKKGITNGNGAKPEPVPVPMELPERESDKILIANIRPSTFEPQARRRARFTEAEITDLAENIRQHGLIQAIVVRPLGGKGPNRSFEIVAGERRFLAVKALGSQFIDCTIRHLTEAEAFSIQMAENLQRKDPHPVDEAHNYKYMRDDLGLSVDEIALRVGQKTSYLENRLKLLTLDQAVLDAFEKGQILFGHALEIAKYPVDAHKPLMSLTATNRGSYDMGMYSVPKFVERIEEYYLRRLSRAPFPIKSTELRADGLACGNCPDRTGANATLFENGTGRKDSCLKPACWNEKTNAFVQIQRREIALPEFQVGSKLSETEERKVEAIPLVAGQYMSSRDPHPAKFIQRGDYEELKKPGECDKGKIGVFFNGDRVGQKVHFCIDPTCKKHKGKYNSGGSSSSKKQVDPDERRQRKEELIDIFVGELVRKFVLKAAAEKFAREFIITGGQEDLAALLVTQMYTTASGGPHHHTRSKIVEGIVSDWDSNISFKGLSWEPEKAAEVFKKLPSEMLNRILFLFAYGNTGAMYFDAYKSQARMRGLAQSYSIDYVLVDAEHRLLFAEQRHKKHVPLYKKYLDDVRAGKKNVKTPRPYFEKYQPKD